MGLPDASIGFVYATLQMRGKHNSRPIRAQLECCASPLVARHCRALLRYALLRRAPPAIYASIVFEAATLSMIKMFHFYVIDKHEYCRFDAGIFPSSSLLFFIAARRRRACLRFFDDDNT